MPGNILFSDLAFPQVAKGDDVEASLKKVLNYQFLLNEQLKYSLYNLGEDNFNEVEWDNLTQPIYASIGDAQEKLTELSLSQEGLGVRVADSEKGIAELAITAQGLLARVSNAEGSISAIRQTVNSITLSVSSASSNNQTSSTIQLTKNGVLIGTGKINATTRSEVQSLVNIGLDSLTLSVTNGEGFSTLTLATNGATIMTSGQINLGGEVVFRSNLSDGVTRISGSNILTGTINADVVGVQNAFKVMNGSTVYGRMGLGYGSTGTTATYGVKLSDPTGGNYLMATTGGVRMQSGEYFYCSGTVIYASTTINQSSDRRKKKDISYDMSRYEDFYLALQPCFFRLTNGSSNRYHTGFIAQEVEEAIEAHGLTTWDLAALVKNPLPEGYSEDDPEYSLRYAEFIALNTHMVQKLWQRLDRLEAQLTAH